jgi:galactose-1-phosphate uridylyltransferase
MGLAILPGRLLYECNEILGQNERKERNERKEINEKKEINERKEKKETESILKHRDWIKYLEKYDSLNWDILRFEIGEKMSRVLKDAGVYKNIESFKKFLDYCGA